MTPGGLPFRFIFISGRATEATEGPAQMLYCSGCAGAIGFAGGVVNRYRITSAPMRNIVGKGAGRRRRDGAECNYDRDRTQGAPRTGSPTSSPASPTRRSHACTNCCRGNGMPKLPSQGSLTAASSGCLHNDPRNRKKERRKTSLTLQRKNALFAVHDAGAQNIDQLLPWNLNG